tara:strand:+ start:1046 stop:1192 length:147 start_codon:yes stop_codon:yes gene_type:complete
MSVLKKLVKIEKLNDKISLLCEEIKEEIENENPYEDYEPDEEELEELD